MPKIRKKKRNGQILEKQKYQNTRKEIYNLYSFFLLNRYYILLIKLFTSPELRSVLDLLANIFKQH